MANVFILYLYIYVENWIVLMGYLLSFDRLVQTSSSMCAKQNSERERLKQGTGGGDFNESSAGFPPGTGAR